MKQVWIVGKYNGPDKLWEFQGVFSSEAKASAACIDWNWFYGPAKINDPLPTKAQGWPGCTYPNMSVAGGISYPAKVA
jgi:hypothetical protein